MFKSLEKMVKNQEPFSLDNSPQTRRVYMEKGVKDGIVYGTLGGYRIAIRSNIGLKRTENEDNFGIYVPEPTVIIANGMGGRHLGAKAAEITVKSLTRPVKRSLFGKPKETYKLRERISEADEEIKKYGRVKKLPSSKIPGAALGTLSLKDRVLRPAYLGDVRTYIFDEQGKLRYMTADNSATQNALFNNEIEDEDQEVTTVGKEIQHNYITTCVGSDSKSEIQDFFIKVNESTELTTRGKFKTMPNVEDIVFEVPINPRWKWMVADDGLHQYLTHTSIIDVINCSRSPEEAVNALVDGANQVGGGIDNITLAFGVYDP